MIANVAARRPRRDNGGVPEEAGQDPILDALWLRVLAAWHDEAAHVALLDHAVRSLQLPEIAGRYRPLLDDPAKTEEAKKRLDRIIVTATQMLLSMKTRTPGKVPLPITLSAVSVSMFLLAWLAWAVWGRH
ncbi:MAG: hypothetical protein M3O36_07765 [Myxococcota bacterium]|nr:hypothetical protein [Myxococcota bacterium]